MSEVGVVTVCPHCGAYNSLYIDRDQYGEDVYCLICGYRPVYEERPDWLVAEMKRQHRRTPSRMGQKI